MCSVVTLTKQYIAPTCSKWSEGQEMSYALTQRSEGVDLLNSAGQGSKILWASTTDRQWYCIFATYGTPYQQLHGMPLSSGQCQSDQRYNVIRCNTVMTHTFSGAVYAKE
jgi:hypothetical protein